MKLSALKHTFVAQLTEHYGRDEAYSFFKILADFYLGLNAAALVLEANRMLTIPELEAFEKAKTRLEQQEPIQYILGETEFYGLRFRVNEKVLIPRPETEELVAWIVEHVQAFSKKEQPAKKTIKILDIGTGSGCIAIALAKELPQAEVYAMEVSLKALEVARQNAAENQVMVHFLHQDIFSMERFPVDFDIIVSNPPYVRELEKEAMKPNVLNNEPHLALFVSDTDPLVFYKKIITLACSNLQTSRMLFFEINQYLGKEMVTLLQKQGYTAIELKKDVFNRSRMLKGCILTSSKYCFIAKNDM